MLHLRKDTQTTSQPPRRGLSIRARLMLLALLAVVPLTLDRVRVLENGRAERIDMARADVVDLTQRAADAQAEVINSTRAILQMAARVYVGMIQDGKDCSSFLGRFASDVPWIKGFSVVGTDGHVTCSTHAAAIGMDVSDRLFIQEAQRNWDFVLSDYALDRAYYEPSVIAAYPALGRSDSDSAIILALSPAPASSATKL